MSKYETDELLWYAYCALALAAVALAIFFWQPDLW